MPPAALLARARALLAASADDPAAWTELQGLLDAHGPALAAALATPAPAPAPRPPAKPRRPKTRVTGLRIARGPHKRDPRLWYWRRTLWIDGAETTLWTGWYSLAEAEARAHADLATAMPPSEVALQARARREREGATVFDALDWWVAQLLRRADLKPATVQSYRSRAELHLGRLLGDLPVRALGQRETWLQYRDQRLAEGASPATVAQEIRRTGRVFFRWCIAEALLPEQRMPTVELRVRGTRNAYTPTPAEIQRVLQHWRDAPYTWPLMLLLVDGGYRIGEVSSLTADRLDLPGRLVHVDGKTGARSVPLSERVAAELAAWMRARPAGPGASLWGVADASARTALRRALDRACADAEVPRFTPHGLRRAKAQALVDAGFGPEVIAAFLGHSVEISVQRYRRLGAATLRDAVDATALPHLQLVASDVG